MEYVRTREEERTTSHDPSAAKTGRSCALASARWLSRRHLLTCTLNVSKPLDLHTIAELTCAACKKPARHEVIYVGDVLHHRRCSACGVVQVYRVEGNNRALRCDFETVLATVPAESKTKYRADRSFQAGDLVEHAKFGLGYAVAVVGSKMTILFEDESRVLACAPAPLPAPDARPARQARGWASKNS